MIQKQVTVNGSWITVDVYGDADKDAIVLIPGAMSDATAWRHVARHLDGRQTVAVVNRRGRHPSGPLTDAYSLATEVKDAAAALKEFAGVRALFGWSYGGLIALHLANEVAVPHLIAYEPIMAPFGAQALPDLRHAHEEADLDGTVEVALRRVTGMSEESVEALRSDEAVWNGLLRLASPVYAETLAINEAGHQNTLATMAERIDLVVGELNRGRAPYGTSFDDVASRTPTAVVHELSGQGHLAHLEAPEHLAALVNRLLDSTA